MSIIIFLLVLFVLILVHEWGHFIMAKKTGMKVDEFGIGFPPRLFGVKKGETEYTLNALPIGGFVRIYGENLELEEDADPKDKPRAFGNRPLWAQAVVLIAGVTMNVLLAWFLFFITFMVGVPTAVDETTASPNAVLQTTSILPDSPVDGQIPAGATILSLESEGDLEENLTPTSFSGFIEEHKDNEISINYKMGEDTGTAKAVPKTGLIPGNEDKLAVGVGLALVETVNYSFFGAIVASFNSTISGLVAIVSGLYDLLVGAFTGTGDLTQVAGPVGIVGMVGDAAEFGITALLTFTAIISLNLAIINLLPIPALDGGRLLFVAIEAVTRKRIDPVWAGRLNLIGFVALMILMVVVTYNDIVRIFTS